MAAVVAIGVSVGSVVRAVTPSIDGPATVTSAAERIVVESPGLKFPMAPVPMCEVFNNFGGSSKALGGGGHQGVDIGATLGQPVYAVEDGVMYRKFIDLGSAAGFGWGLLGNSDTKYRYYHLSGFAEGLEVNDPVAAGDLIGYVGDTGNASPGGYHLHFEVRPGPDPHDKPVDPIPLLSIPRACTVYPKK